MESAARLDRAALSDRKGRFGLRRVRTAVAERLTRSPLAPTLAVLAHLRRVPQVLAIVWGRTGIVRRALELLTRGMASPTLRLPNLL